MLERSPPLSPAETWPPDYAQTRRDRAARLRILHQDHKARLGAIALYGRGHEGCIAFIEDWCETFDPRNAGTSKPTTMPFILFPRQRDFVEFLYRCYVGEAAGLVEKSRDMGATWLCVAFSVWMFLFVPGARIGWGSRKAANVDKIGDMDSIFEKIRFQMRTTPRVFWPPGFSEDGMAFMKVHAPDGRSITGESGDDIGRGGRTRIYFKDESAHYEHPDAIEASLSDTTRVQFDLSSVNGLGNVFHRKREGGVEWSPGEDVQRGKTNVFVMDWSDHPDKTQAWYDERESKAIDDGLLHVFRQEVDRNYAASVKGVVIPADWVKSAIDAHVRLKFDLEDEAAVYAGLDVADEGGDTNALALRVGVVLTKCDQWGERDTGATTRRALDGIAGHASVSVQYDCIGVGAGVKSEVNRLNDEEDEAVRRRMERVYFMPWNAGAAVLNPDRRIDPTDRDTPLNKDFYRNLKAQAWWQLRRRFEKTHRAVEADDPRMFPHDELISLPRELPLLRTLQKELSQPTASKDTRMKMIIDKKPDGTRSPNLADAVVMCYWPVGDAVYRSMDWV